LTAIATTKFTTANLMSEYTYDPIRSMSLLTIIFFYHHLRSKWSHELVGGAAGFAAMREYEKYEEKNGKPQNHQLAKELLAGFAGAEVDKLFETKGLDFLDREKAKRHAQEEAQNNLNY